MNAGTFGAGRARLLWAVGLLFALINGMGNVATAQILQAGDIVVGGARVINQLGGTVGRIYRYRNGAVDTIFDGEATPGLGPVGRLFIDSQARIVFTTFGCGGNANSSALWRVDPATGIAEQLACFPYVATPANIPPGLPSDATRFYLLGSVYPTKSLRITMDDDVNGGLPQVAYTEGYGCAINVTINGQTKPMAFRYLPEEDRFEEDVSLGLLTPSGGVPQILVEGTQTYYANDNQIGRAQPSAVVDFSYTGDLGSVSGHVVVGGPNELMMSGDILDNTLIPNFSVQCGNLQDDNVPETPFSVLSGIKNLDFLGSSMFVTSNSGAAGRPYLFNLAPRSPFLNPNTCQYSNAFQYDGPIQFSDGENVEIGIGDDSRILGTQHAAGTLVSVEPGGAFATLATDLVSPGGVAVYPPRGDVQTARNLTLRIDQAVGNVLLTDPDGKQLGYAADGSEINDFGERGRILAPGAPANPARVYTLSEPSAGTWDVQVAGTNSGAYTLRAYLADTSEGGTTASADGSAQAGGLQRFALVVTPPLSLTLEASCGCGDINHSGIVDLADDAVLARCFGLSAPGANCDAQEFQCSDLDGSGVVDLNDFSLFLQVLGTTPSGAPPDCG